MRIKQCPPVSSHSDPLQAASSSSAGFPPNHPPASHQPDTPPREPGLICCWMERRLCWSTGAETDPGEGSWRCLRLEWHCDTPPAQTQMGRVPPADFLDRSWGPRCFPGVPGLPFDSGLLGRRVWGVRHGEDSPGSRCRCLLRSCSDSREDIRTNHVGVLKM